MIRKTLLVLGLALSAGVALANAAPITSLEREAFQKERAAIEHELSSGKRYAKLDDEERASIEAALARIGSVLEQSGSAGEMATADRQAVERDRDLVNRLLATATAVEDRLVCRREKTLGSNMATRSCRTLSQIKHDRDDAARALQNLQRGGPSSNN